MAQQYTVTQANVRLLRQDATWLKGVQRWANHYRFLILALVGTVIFHAGLLLNGTLWDTYDAFVHIFFADHYARGWFDLWEERWYTGFTMVSYPPLTHQINAVLSKVVGLKLGYILLLMIATVLTTLGVYRFSRLWVGHKAASYAALFAVVTSSIAETVHVFGQSPTMFVMGILLNALPFIWFYVDEGDVKNLFRSWAIIMVACAGHHVTTIFGMIFFCGPVMATLLWRKFRSPMLHEREIEEAGFRLRDLPIRIRYRVRRVAPAFVRCGIFGVGFILLAVTTVLPYWLWSRSDPITQVTIPHGSRESFIEETQIGIMFFLVPWGLNLILLPYVFYKGWTSSSWILTTSLALLTLLGTGGTTPIPAKLLGGAFYILTLDRFTFWASIITLPFVGVWFESITAGRLGRWVRAHFGGFWQVAIPTLYVITMIGIAIFVANLTQFRKFQPKSIDVQPLVDFLSKDNHDAWRYMTLGFGDQMAWLGAQTTALNVEGNYHSARRLPEMTTTPIERMDGAKYQSLPGLGTLHQILSVPQRYNLKYIFGNDAFYDPLLHFYGWQRVGALDNGIVVWERADVPPLPTAIPQVDYPDWQRIMWGTLPFGSLFVTAFVFTITALLPMHPSQIFPFNVMSRWGIIQFFLINPPYDTRTKPQNTWQFWRRFTRRIRPNLRLRPLRWLYGSLLGIGLIGGVAFSLFGVRQALHTPERIVLYYYDDVDFKRFTDSYQWLKTDLTLDEYMRYLSLRGGLVASYSKLNNLRIVRQQRMGEAIVMTVELEWLTSLGTYPETRTHHFVRTVNGWRILLDVEPPPLPTETFIITEEPKFFIDLPIPSLADGAFNRGVLDRTLLAIANTNVVYAPNEQIGFVPEEFEIERFNGRWNGLVSVVGYVQNRDVYPSHVTLTAIFRDENDIRLGEMQAASEFVHQLLPMESTPFRIDFEGAYATQILNLEDIATVELVVRGVPTRYNLERPLVRLDNERIYNAGTQPIDIPSGLIPFYNHDDELIWVERVYHPLAIKPGETLDFPMVSAPENITELDVLISLTGPRLDETITDLATDQIILTGFTR